MSLTAYQIQLTLNLSLELIIFFFQQENELVVVPAVNDDLNSVNLKGIKSYG